MAHLIPNSLLGDATPEALKVFRLLKRLPDESYVVWQRLAAEPGPDFWVLHQDRRTLFLSVATTLSGQAHSHTHPQPPIEP